MTDLERQTGRFFQWSPEVKNQMCDYSQAIDELFERVERLEQMGEK